MANATKAKANTDNLVKQALLKIALSESSLRLTGKGDGFVFASAAAANKDAIARLKNESQPLVIEQGEGKAATLALSRAGLEQILDVIPSEKFIEVISRFAEQVPPPARVMFLQELVRKNPIMVTGLVSLLDRAVAAEKIELAHRAKEIEQQRAAEAESLAALERWKQRLEERKKQRIEALQMELRAEGAEPEPIIAKPAQTRASPTKEFSGPQGDEDIGFRRNVARRLVSSWVDAWESNKHEAREFLESAIWNVSGFRQVGEVGQRLSFDGRYHEGGPGLFTNDPVQIGRPGWVLEEEDDSEYVVLKARVIK